MKKQWMTWTLLIAMLAASACGGSTPADTTAADTTGETTPAETEMSFDPDLPEKDFGGYEFTFAVRGDGKSNGAWHSHDLIAEDLTGETLNDAIYQRTSYIEEKYNVKFDLMWCGETGLKLTDGEMASTVSKLILAGEDEIDAILSSPYTTVGFMMNDYLVDLNTVEYLNLAKPWWDQNANANLSFNGKIFFTTGELTYIDNKCTYSMIFSKNVADMYDIESPYDAVRSGTWTLDKLISDSKKVVSDLNGDSVMDHNDRYGFASWQDNCFGIIHASGNTFGKINDKGEPELTFYTERMVNTWEKLIEFSEHPAFLQLRPGHAFYSAFNTGNAVEPVFATLLENDQLLYAYSTTHMILQYRDCESDFGIIPMPKYDEKQDRYYSTAHGYGTTLLSIPVTATDTSRTGLILEAFAAKSMELVTPAFYDVTLTGKTIRDEDSAEMLEIIYGSKIYDIGYFFQWGNLTNIVLNSYNAKDINISSFYKEAESAAMQGVEDALEVFSTLE